MAHRTRRLAALVTAVSACALAACGSAEQPPADTSVTAGMSPTVSRSATPSTTAADTPEPTTSAQTPTSQAEAAPLAPAAPAPEITASLSPQTSNEGKYWGGDDYDPATAAKLPHERLDVGTQVDILGTNVEICATGGFYGIHYIGASPTLGCDAGNEVSQAALKDESPEDNVHFSQPKPVRAAGRTFNCTEQGNIVLTCVDDEGNSVLMW
ncbi:hypothetical protein [Corynebacterium aquilae]|uniref:hypothetical protein n=1 Tax=Corynebacterium aquilae TaxID=203263 RepID=UPI0009531334|nr:hypothetical protein [Corynebacterium aquilae]